tara:strand:- start:174 stop:617 length:444 start_codon:yes stop_codon:yes gene_type:complete
MSSQESMLSFNREFESIPVMQSMSPLGHVPPIPIYTEEMHQKHIVDECKRCEQFKKEHPPPTIAPGTILPDGPRMLLRSWACENNPYDIRNIIKEIKINRLDYKTRFIQELARNENLRKQLEKNDWFDEWIVESKNYIIPTNYNSKY